MQKKEQVLLVSHLVWEGRLNSVLDMMSFRQMDSNMDMFSGPLHMR